MPAQLVSRRRFAAAVAGLLLACLAAAYIACSYEMRNIRERLSAESRIVQTRHGPVEFAIRGRGPAVLVLHGAGGGYDQGISIARAFGGEGFRWIAASRFGYLRTPLPEDASTLAQADALADLLDGLGIDRVAILAMSGGVPPSLQFAQRYPARTAALVLLSTAPYTPLTADEQRLPVPTWIYQSLFGSNFPYWALAKVGRPILESIFDAKPELRAASTPDERAFVAEMVDGFAPVTQRANGLRNEAAAIDPGTRYQLEELVAPTLVVHARDDGINPVAFGEYTARHISGAEFMPLTTGGHLLLGHHAEVRTRVREFLREYAIDPRH